MKIALQLYSIREYTKDRAALEASLAEVKKAGYDYVETAGMYGLSAAEMAELLNKYGLSAVSTHTGFEALADIKQLVEDHKAMGCVNVSVPGMPGRWYNQSRAGYIAFAEKMQAAAASLAMFDMTLSYHNHGSEFLHPATDTVRGMTHIMENAKDLNMQLDIGHAHYANENPADWIRKYFNRIVSFHIKDVVHGPDNKRIDPPIGEGEVDWDAVCAAIKVTSGKIAIVELEDLNKDDPWGDCKKSYDFIAGKLLG